jgi:hypothetical protein
MKIPAVSISGLLVIASGIFSLACNDKKNHEESFFDGSELYSTVKKYVSLGEHRTGTPVDSLTVEWLSDELQTVGFDVKYTKFSLRQFFPEKVSVSIPGNNRSFDAFPFWYLNENINLSPEGYLTTDTSLNVVKGKIVLLNFTFGQSGKSADDIQRIIQKLIQAGTTAIIGYKENKADEIVAFNVPVSAKPWDIPIVIVSPSDAENIALLKDRIVRVTITGAFKDVEARNIYGKIGSGDRFVVISTPISGWFRCGGERGPGIAIWLALAKWVAAQKLPYTFVFTGNSGHEMDFRGAHEFLKKDAPSPDKTQLWIHLGAGIATLSWKETPDGLVKENTVDAGRNFFYSSSVKNAFDTAFFNVSGSKWNTQERNGGELLAVAEKGYPNILGVSHSHAYFHASGDDAEKTSPEILHDAALVFCRFLNEYLTKGRVRFERFENNPIITSSLLSGSLEDNINGPSLIKAPEWLPGKLGTYYLYFAHHKGKYIRLAYADDLRGPWKIYDPGTLQLSETIGSNTLLPSEGTSVHNGVETVNDDVQHIASPDVHIDEVNKEITMFFHTPSVHNGKQGQYSYRATSKDGINFQADTAVLGESYFRVFEWKGNHYAIARTGIFYRSVDGGHSFEEGNNPFEQIQTKSNFLRHAAVKVYQDKLLVFYSRIGDTPERIVLSEIALKDDWTKWKATPSVDVLQPEKEYEGGDLPLTTSKAGLFWGRTRELRDPAVYVENDTWYLLYSVAGESGIAIGKLSGIE